MSVLSITKLTKIYNSGKVALDNIDLDIEEGCFLGLLGPNGAGKSSLINILGGLVNKTSGKILVNNYDFDLLPHKAKSSLGIVPQELNLDPFFTVYETIENYAGYYSIPKSQRKTLDLIEILGLTEKIDTKPRGLSGGMKRRLLIAKALIHNPALVILDEPSAGMDIKLRENLWNYLREINKSGTSIILTTHYLEEAEKLCNKIAIINHGKITAIDNKDKFMDILDSKIIKIILADEILQLPAGLLNICNCEFKNNELSINYNKSKVSMDEIFKYVLKLQNKILDIKTTESALEDVFKYLIEKSDLY